MTELKVNLSVDRGSLSDTARKITDGISKGAGGLMGGFQKGMFGGMGEAGAAPGGLMGTFGKMAGSLGMISIATNQAVELGKKILGTLEKSSPYLKGILDIFNRSFLLFFKPFGDFLAWMLRPLAVMLLRASAAWIRFTQGGGAGGLTQLDFMGPAGQFVKDFLGVQQLIANIGEGWPGTLFDLKKWITDTVSSWSQTAFSMLNWITDITSDWVQTAFDIHDWILKIVGGWSHTLFDIGDWITRTIASWFGGAEPPKPKAQDPVRFVTLGGTAAEARTVSVGPVNSNNDISVTINTRGKDSSTDVMNFLSKAFRVPMPYNQFGWLR